MTLLLLALGVLALAGLAEVHQTAREKALVAEGQVTGQVTAPSPLP